HVIARGRIVTDPSVDDFDVSDGLGVHVVDAASLDVTVAFLSSECTASHGGRFRCGRSDHPATQVKFRCLKSSHVAYRYLVRLGHVSLPTSLTAPVTLTLTTNDVVDRVGSSDTCSATSSGLVCH